MVKSLLAGVNVGINRLHTIIVQEEAHGGLKPLGEYRSRGTMPKGDKDALAQIIRQSILEATRDAYSDPDDLLTIGVALPGQVDFDNETLLFAPNLDVRNMPLVMMLKEHFPHSSIALINDVCSQGIGEQRIGAGKNVKDLVYLFVSYGIGSSIIINEKLYTGAENLAGEFGHIAVCYDGPRCSCGKNGCLEAFSSRRAIIEAIQEEQKAGAETILSNMINLSEKPLDLSAALIAEAIDQDDALTIEVVKKAAHVFGIGIASIINLINPRMIVLGGDVIDNIDLFFEQAKASAKERCLSNNGEKTTILRGELGTTAGAYGAAVFAKEHEQREHRS